MYGRHPFDVFWMNIKIDIIFNHKKGGGQQLCNNCVSWWRTEPRKNERGIKRALRREKNLKELNAPRCCTNQGCGSSSRNSFFFAKIHIRIRIYSEQPDLEGSDSDPLNLHPDLEGLDPMNLHPDPQLWY